jgi:hypothetical protein
MKTTNKVLVKSASKSSYVDIGQELPIILIHGLFLEHTAFDEQIKAFADPLLTVGSPLMRIIAIDIHGRGF